MFLVFDKICNPGIRTRARGKGIASRKPVCVRREIICIQEVADCKSEPAEPHVAAHACIDERECLDIGPPEDLLVLKALLAT